MLSTTEKGSVGSSSLHVKHYPSYRKNRPKPGTSTKFRITFLVVISSEARNLVTLVIILPSKIPRYARDDRSIRSKLQQARVGRESVAHPAFRIYSDDLRMVFTDVRRRRPFTIDAIVVLPDHLRSVWTLPVGDGDFSTRWRDIKARFSARIPKHERLSRRRARRGGTRGVATAFLGA